MKKDEPEFVWDWWFVEDTALENDIRAIEQSHPLDNAKCFKFAVLYAKPGQIDLHQVLLLRPKGKCSVLRGLDGGLDWDLAGPC